MEYNIKAEQLLLQCEASEAEHPVMHVMPLWDALAEDWMVDPGRMPNGGMRDEFSFWCSLESRATYAIYSSFGFFGRGEVMVAGDLEIAAEELIGDLGDQDEIHIAGYRWEESGSVFLLSNREDNEAWADLDDWIYEAFFFSGFWPDGSALPECPPGHCQKWDSDEDGKPRLSFVPIPKLDIEKSLMQIGFSRPARPGSDVEMLEELWDQD